MPIDTEKSEVPKDPETTQTDQQPQTPKPGDEAIITDQPRMVPLTVHAQYIKDLSFENPHTPKSLMPGQAVPSTTINVTLDAKKMDDMQGNGIAYEVTLHIEAQAMRDQDPVFIIEMDYGTVCSVAKDVPEEHHHPLLMIEIPKLAFPFARQILAEITSQAGYPPLLLNPVDFEGMYRDQYLAQVKAANTAAV